MITNLKKLFVLTNWEMYIEQYGEYAYLLSNSTKQSTNNARIEYKYPVILPNIAGYWLFCTVKDLLN